MIKTVDLGPARAPRSVSKYGTESRVCHVTEILGGLGVAAVDGNVVLLEILNQCGSKWRRRNIQWNVIILACFRIDELLDAVSGGELGTHVIKTRRQPADVHTSIIPAAFLSARVDHCYARKTIEAVDSDCRGSRFAAN